MAVKDRLFSAEQWSGLELPSQLLESNPPTVEAGRAIDLYWWWHGLTDFRAFRPTGHGVQPHTYSFIVEGNLVEFDKWSKTRPEFRVPHAYFVALNNPKKTVARFFTVNVDVPLLRPSLIAKTEGEVDREKRPKLLYELANCKFLHRIQLGFPRGEQKPDSLKNDNDALGRNNDEYVRTDFAPPPPIERFEVTPLSRKPAKVVIGVIDDGAAFAHAAMRASSGVDSRAALIWNQTQQLSYLSRQWWIKPSAPEGRFAWHGVLLDSASISEIMGRHRAGEDIDELECYDDLVSEKGSTIALRLRESHGAAVLTTAAGSLDAACVIPAGADFNSVSRPRELVDAASQAPVIFVDLPPEQIGISSGRWMPICALDGVRFILDHARSHFSPLVGSERVPVVINISSGASAGAHDGNSMFESALSELLDADPLVAVTLAAGNSRLARSHVEKEVNPGGDCELCLRIPVAKKFETYLEIWPTWLDAQGKPVPFEPGMLSIEIISPTGDMKRIELRQEALFCDSEDVVIAAARFTGNAVQSKGRPMALLVVAATHQHESLPSAPYGNWVVRCTNKSKINMRVKAWIERDEVVFGIRQPQLAHLVEDADPQGSVLDWDEDTDRSVSRAHTTSNFANAKGAFAVAAGVGGKQDGFVSSYSGAGGPGAYDGSPLFIARADRSPAQPGIPAWGNYRSARRHMNGTSIAAPQAARWIANAFAIGNDRNHIACLTHAASPRKHPHLEGIVAAGEGRLFVEATEAPASECKDVPYR